MAFIMGILFWGGFNWSLELTNTEQFCISCHEMRDYIFKEYKKSSHYMNHAGVRATCPDCHVPKQWVDKVLRKIRASNELFHKLRGSINTPEKFYAKRLILARKVWDNMRASNSRECRNCHASEFMRMDTQPPIAEQMHQWADKHKKTCIDCHQGITHTLPVEFDREAQWDKFHEQFEQDKISCSACHENLPTPGEW
jgi:cytochrome c-type protein NapC